MMDRRAFPSFHRSNIPTFQRLVCSPMSSSAPPASNTTDLKRELGLFDAVMINAGTMIASAIFIVPATVAVAVQGTAVMTLVWVIGGIVSLLGDRKSVV